MSQKIEFGSEARKKLLKGIKTLSDAVTSTLGPNGRNVIYSNNGSLVSTKDGVSVAKRIESLEDPVENLGVQMIKQAAIKTADAAGDGTTTSTLLTYEMISEGMDYLNYGANAIEIKRGIDTAVKEVITFLRENVKEDISSEEQLEQIAAISANNDVEIGKLISTAIKKVGKEGVVHIEESKAEDTYLETVEGMQFDRGYKSHFFVTNNNNMTCTLEDCLVLIVDKKISQVKEILPILERVSSQGKSLLIIAEDIEQEALATMIVNKIRGSLNICAIKSPEFGDRRKLVLEDIAILTGGQVLTADKGMKLDKFDPKWFGTARIITVSKDQTTIVDGKGDEDKIIERIEELKSQIDKAGTGFEREKLQERLAKFVGGVAIIHVGGKTETEIKEKKDRVEDALHATKAALEEGIVPGGGIALLNAREAISDKTSKGGSIVYKACSMPLNKILKNAGFSDERVHRLIHRLSTEDTWMGYDIKTEQLVDMKKYGIIDPAKVSRVALENAASVAGTILLTESTIVDNKEDKPKNEYDPMMGMM